MEMALWQIKISECVGGLHERTRHKLNSVLEDGGVQNYWRNLHDGIWDTDMLHDG